MANKPKFPAGGKTLALPSSIESIRKPRSTSTSMAQPTPNPTSKPTSKSTAKSKPDPIPPADGSPWRPSKNQLLAARKKKVPDLIAPNLQLLFCGINPGLYSAAVGHHFAGPGNLLWPTLFASGFTSRVMNAFEESELLELGIGITNLVPRASATADELDHDELHRGARAVTRKVLQYQPRYVAFLGLQAYRIAFERRKAVVGLQPERIGTTCIWLLPNPSGLNAYHQPAILAQMFRELRQNLPDRLSPTVG